jgi:hypothetical protein
MASGLCHDCAGAELEVNLHPHPRSGVRSTFSPRISWGPSPPWPAELARLLLRAAPKLFPALPGRLEISAQQLVWVDFDTRLGGGRGGARPPSRSTGSALLRLPLRVGRGARRAWGANSSDPALSAPGGQALAKPSLQGLAEAAF